MVSAVLATRPDPHENSFGIPDSPIDFSVPYRKREKSDRHFGFLPFFVRKPWQVIQEYIKHYTAPGALVCDPFVGGGVTAVEALVLGRRAVATDINPVARFITHMKAISPVDLAALDVAYDRVRIMAQAPIESLNEMADAEVYDLLSVLDYPRNSIPQKVRRSGADTVDQLHTSRQLAGLAILRQSIMMIDDVVSRDLLRVALANTARYTNLMYSGRGGEYTGSPYRGNANFLRRWSYSLATPQQFHELHVWPTFELRYRAVYKAKEETNRLIGNRYNGSDFTLADVPASQIHTITGEGTVDYCLTDPPYSDQIRFLDLSTFWAAWLDLPITEEDRRAELLIDSKKSNRADFEHKWSDSSASIARALKEDCWLTLVYKHRDLSLWQSIVSICETNGLHFVNGTWQEGGIPSTRQIENPNSNPRGDMYLNFRKMPRQRFISIYHPDRVRQLPTRANYIEHEAERLIVAYLGADVDLVHSGVVQQVLNSRAFQDYEANPSRVDDDLKQVLSGPRFAVWQPPQGKPLYVMASQVALDTSLDATDRARYAVFDLLRRRTQVTEGEVTQHLLSLFAEEVNLEVVSSDISALLRSVGRKVGPGEWQFDAKRVTDYKQLRLFFKPSGADVLREQLERSVSRQRGQQLRPNMEGFALLRDRLREANSRNRAFEQQYTRLQEVLQTVFLRLVTDFSDRIDQVVTIGEWADEGIDLRNLPYDDIVLGIVTRSARLSFDLQWQLAGDVFTDLRDEDIVVQFHLETQAKRRQLTSLAEATDQSGQTSIVLLDRV